MFNLIVFHGRKNVAGLIFVASCMTCIVKGLKVVDLTHVQNADTIYWPGNPKYNFTIIYRGKTDNGFWYESNSFQTAEHGGTHLDAPAHFAESTSRTQQIPIDNLIGPGVIINVKSEVAVNPDYRVTITDLTSWETVHGKIPDGAVVIMNSGWTYNYPNKTLTFGTQSVDDPSTFHFPGWHEDAVEWLVKNRNVNVVGTDTPSNDYGQSTTFPAHVVLGSANISGVENVANLDSIPEAGSIVYVAAIKLYDGSGGPARVFATFPENPVSSGLCHRHTSLVTAVLILLLISMFDDVFQYIL